MQRNSLLFNFKIVIINYNYRLQVEESDLTPERSSKAVNRCIVELSNPGGGGVGGGLGRHSVGARNMGVGGGASRSLAADSIGGWGEGKG